MTSLNFTGPGAPYSLLGDRSTKGYVVPCDPNPDWKDYRLISTVPDGGGDKAIRVPCWCGILARKGSKWCHRHRVGSSAENPNGTMNRLSSIKSRASRLRWRKWRAARKEARRKKAA